MPTDPRAWHVERTPDLVRLLERPNAEALPTLGVSAQTARSLRRELGIEPYRTRPRPWTAELVARLGQEPIARDAGITSQSVGAKRRELGIAPFVGPVVNRPWTDQEIAALGTAPDDEVAAQIGRTAKAVRHKRDEFGIPTVLAHPPRVWKKSEIAKLGTTSDSALAAELGLTHSALSYQRTIRNIPGFRPVRFAGTEAPSPDSARRPTVGSPASSV